MSIQYSGLTIVNTTFATTTRQDVVTGIANALSSAGWTNISGSGTGNQVWKSMTTPQGYAIRINLLDPGSGNCAQILLQNATGSVIQSGHVIYLLPGSTYRIIASGYQFFVFVPTSTTSRTVAMGGVPYVPSFLTGTISSVGWLGSNSNSDTDTGGENSWRTGYPIYGDAAVLYNGSIWADTGNTGKPWLFYQGFYNQTGQMQYVDGSAMIYDALLAMGQNAAWNPQIVGQLWDASLIGATFTIDITATFDSHNWWNFTNASVASNSVSLFLVVP